MAVRRLQKEFRDLQRHPEGATEWVRLGPVHPDDMFLWQAHVTGPAGSAYEGGRFVITVSIPTDYPFRPPTLRMVTKIYHPRITVDGVFCCICNLLNGSDWSPAFTISELFRGVVGLLEDPLSPSDLFYGRKPCIVRPEIMKILKEDPTRFKESVQAHLKEHGSAPFPWMVGDEDSEGREDEKSLAKSEGEEGEATSAGTPTEELQTTQTK